MARGTGTTAATPSCPRTSFASSSGAQSAFSELAFPDSPSARHHAVAVLELHHHAVPRSTHQHAASLALAVDAPPRPRLRTPEPDQIVQTSLLILYSRTSRTDRPSSRAGHSQDKSRPSSRPACAGRRRARTHRFQPGTACSGRVGRCLSGSGAGCHPRRDTRTSYRGRSWSYSLKLR